MLEDAVEVGECIQLSTENTFSSGAMWNEIPIDLNSNFTYTAEINLGCNDDGADGICFVLIDKVGQLGLAGGELGFGGLENSLGIEFDTYKNNEFSDPTEDHMAILKSGGLNHSSSNNLAGPIQADPDNKNIERCQYFDITISWNAASQTLEVFFDCKSRLTYQGDIVSEIFNGNPIVYWGFTSATGSLVNEHFVCQSSVYQPEPLSDFVMCPGGSIQLKAPEALSYLWSPSDGLSATDIQNPEATPQTTTTYFVRLEISCIEFIYDTVTIQVVGDSILFDLKNELACAGDTLLLDATTVGGEYTWSTQETDPFISIYETGNYAVTVTVNDECESHDGIEATFVTLPEALAESPVTLCPDQMILFDVTVPDASYLWQDGSTDPIYEASSTGQYQVSIDHFCGEQVLSTTVTVEPSCRDLYIPNVFSPNNDGLNDQFILFDAGDITEIISLKIFNRYGGLVYAVNNFQSLETDKFWDGRFKGKIVPTGVYVYLVEVEFKDGAKELISGAVTVLY